MPQIPGETLREWRRSRGWDVPETARRLRRAAGDDSLPAHDAMVRMIRRWESEGLNTSRSERYELLYCAVLDISAAELAAGSGPALEPQVSRHGLLRAAAATSLLDVLASRPGRPVPAALRVDSEMAVGLGNIVLGYRQVYRSAGAAALLGPAVETLGLLTELAPAAGRHQDQIVSLIGQSASLAGVILMLDDGDPAAARSYLSVAVRAAREARDNELLAVALGCEAFRASCAGDAEAGVEYAGEASRLASAARVHPLTRGWTAAVASEMHAATGDEAGCERALGAAAEALGAPVPDEPWKGIGVFSAAKLTAYRGGDLVRLRRYADAQAQLRTALDELDGAQAKHRCTAHIDLATACMLGGDIPEGIRHATEALGIIETTRHADSLKRVTHLYQVAKPSKTAGVREFRSRLLAVTAGAAA